MKITLTLDEMKQLAARHFGCAVEDLTVIGVPEARPVFNYFDFCKKMAGFYDGNWTVHRMGRLDAVGVLRAYFKETYGYVPGLAWSVAVVDDFKHYLSLVGQDDSLRFDFGGKRP